VNPKEYRQSEMKIAAGQYTREEDYWLNRLAGELTVGSFPADHRQVTGFSPGKLEFDITGELFSKIMRLGNQSDPRLFMVLLAGLFVLLHKYTGNDDVIVAAPIYRQEIDAHFINTVLPLRNRLFGGMTFKELLLAVRQTVMEADEHQNYPIDTLVYKLNLAGAEDFSAHTLFDVVLMLENIHKREYISHIQVGIMFVFRSTAEKIEGAVEYNAQKYEPDTVQAIISRFQIILERCLTAVDTRLSDLDLLSDRERRQILEEFNANAADFPAQKTLSRLFEDQAEKSPDQPAVLFCTQDGQESMCYRELDRCADRLAGRLRAAGVRPNSIVGILAERSLDTVCAILAVLKAGGAYLPLDPESPETRIVSMLDDADAEILLGRSGTLKGYSYSNLQGLHLPGVKAHFTRARDRILDFNHFPFPDRSLIDYEKYNRLMGQCVVKNRILIQASRGCPFDCSYCYRIWPKKQVARSGENIFAEIQVYYRLGIRKFDIFMLNIKEGKKLFELIIENRMTEIQLFFPNGFRGDLLTHDYIDLMVRAGTVNLALALETASPRLQELINKRLGLERFRDSVEYLCQKYPQVILELFTLHGIPTETEEEAMMTLDFIKSLRWVHFPYVNVLKIYHHTDMERIALEAGISREAIARSETLAWHELSDTLPFERSFSSNYQADFLSEYVLNKERLLQVLPFQMKILTADELVQKYDSYLPTDIKTFSDLLQFAHIRPEELGEVTFVDEAQDEQALAGFNQGLRAYFPQQPWSQKGLRVLFLDLSQFFSDGSDMLYDVVDPPLGLLYILTYLNERFGERINGKIAKSRLDFDSLSELRALLEEFKPQVLGIRSISFFRDFFHETVAAIRNWGFDIPIVTGGPYATVDSETILKDRHIDIVVLSEGELTFADLIEKMLENDGKLPGDEVLEQIPGIAFIPGNRSGRAYGSAREIMKIDDLHRPVPGAAHQRPGNVNRPDDLAYIIFTSGSTGIPKGVMTEHRQVVNVLSAFGRTYQLDAATQVVQLTDYTFDPSVEQMFATWMFGATLYLPSRELMIEKEDFIRFLDENRIQVINSVPQMLKEILADGPKLPHLRAVISGGEKLTDAIKEQLLSLGYRLYNQYGPTETTIDALMEECSAERVTLGRPIANVQCYILDRDNQPLPIGVPGELFLGGAGVSRGYLNRPELTAERFTRTPAAPLPSVGEGLGVRGEHLTNHQSPLTNHLYRTGDLCRWLPDGRIEFLGRLDHQVKIRGYRIELGEIEAQLLKCSSVSDAAVIVAGEDGNRYLKAFVAAGGDLPASELRSFLARELPEYMIPAQFLMLDRLPLNPNGKVDYRALTMLQDSDLDDGDRYVAPGNEIEKVLAETWEQVLGRTRIGIHDSFFAIGGDSIKSIQIATRLNKAGYKLKMRDLFQFPTIAQLAPLVEKIERKVDQSIITGRVPLTPIQHEFFCQVTTDTHHYNQAVMLYAAEGFDIEAVKAVFRKIQEHHDALRMTFHQENGQVIQTNHGLDYPFSLEIIDLRGDLEQTEAVKTLQARAGQVQAGIDLEKGPLMKLALFRLPDGDRLLIVIHHLVVDGVSWRILFEDIGHLFTQYRQGKPLTLPLKTDSFKLWAEKLGQYAGSKNFLQEKEYWARLESMDIAGLPKDQDEPGNRVGDARSISFSLAEPDTEKLLTQVNEAFGTDINDILATAFGLAVHGVFAQEQVILGLEGHGRQEIIEDIDINRTIGWFTSVYPVRLDLRFRADLERQVKEIKESLHQVPNKGIGHGLLKYLTPAEYKTGLEFKQKPQVSFNYLGQFDTDVKQSTFQFAAESRGAAMSPSAERDYDLDVTGIVSRGRLQVSMTYNQKQFREKTIRWVMDLFLEQLKLIIDFCASRAEKEITPSDLTYKGLTIEQLENIDAMFGK